MSVISENDWELLNAFHDGELSDEDRAVLELRLQENPALAEALLEIEETSRSLKALRPHVTAQPEPFVPRQRKFWFGGLAAAIAIMAFALWSTNDKSPTLLDMHQALLERPFSVAVEDVRSVAVAAGLGVHDLSGANLAPVSAQDIAHGTLAHYAGLNGCRLSYFKVEHAFKLPSGPEVQAIAWTTADGAHHAIVATGMDLEKFDAIAAYLQHLTHDLAQQQVYALMTKATQNAVPCVG